MTFVAAGAVVPLVSGRPEGWRCGSARSVLVPVELLTGASALLCGGLLMARPDGSLLGLPPAVLEGGRFADWGKPVLLLGGLVGLGYLGAGLLAEVRYRHSRTVSVLAGTGLIVFETVEWRWLGYHPLQAVFMAVGAGVVGLAVAGGRPTSRAASTSSARPVTPVEEASGWDAGVAVARRHRDLGALEVLPLT
jgi:hypothetical protein